MQILYSLLAMPAWLTEHAQWIAIGAAALIVLIAFFVGFAKGFTRLGWGALIWAGACALFGLLESKFHNDNPILKIGGIAKLDPGVQSFASTLSIAVVAVLAALVVFALLALLCRPKKRKKAVLRYYREDDDEEIEDEDDEEEETRGERTRAEGRPCAFNRILGGLAAVVNTAVVLAAIACLALVVLDVTPLRGGSLKSLFESGVVAKSWGYIHVHTLDFLLLAIVTAMGYGGYRMGIIRGFRSVFLTVAYIAAVGGAFALPFLKWAADKEWLSFIGKLSGYFGGLIGKALPEGVAVVLGKVACGFVLCIGFCIVVAVIGLLLKLLAKAVAKVPVLRVIDGALSTLFMIALGVLVCALIAALLYLLEYYGFFQSSSLFEAKSSFMSGLYDAFDEYLRPLLEKLGGLVE